MCSQELPLSSFLSDFEDKILKTCLSCRRRKKAYAKPSFTRPPYDFGPSSLATLPLYTERRVLRWTAELKVTLPSLLTTELGFQERRARISALYEGPYSTYVKVPPNTAAKERERRREELKREQW